jgi:hypothetical protein
MSEQHPPEEAPAPGSDPIGPPGSNWTPAPLSASGQASYAAHAGQSPPATGDTPNTTAIGQFAPKRLRAPLLIALVGALIAGAVIYSAVRPAPVSDPSAHRTASPTPSRTPSASASPRGKPFVLRQSDATGVWNITETRWTDKGLEALVQLTLDTGDLTCYFNALGPTAQEAIRSEASDIAPRFPTGPINSGATVSGWVFFPIERGTVLVFLRTVDQAQVSGIEVTG